MFAKKPTGVKRVRHVGLSSTRTSMMTRKDIGCGVADCKLCTHAIHAGRGATVVASMPIILPDSNVVLHNMNALEDARVQNLVFLSTVLNEVQNRNKGIYSRLQRLMADEEKKCYVFANDRHEQTHCVL
uniref:Exosome complex exonuclease RRP44 n=1 Tax=Lygus hesperus TaxID=30085 RepID=A0A146LAB4_LYGHE